MQAIIKHTLSLQEALTVLEDNACYASFTDIITVLQLCRKKKNLDYAKRMYKYVQSCCLEYQKVLGSHIIAMLVECGSVQDAYELFQRSSCRNEYSWTSLIRGFVNCGDCNHAFELYYGMQKDCVSPNSYTFQFLLGACVQMGSITKGRKLHVDITQEGFERHPFVVAGLVHMYTKCGSMDEAYDILNEMQDRDVVMWTALITGYAENRLTGKGVNCLNLMQEEGVLPNTATFVSILRGCSSTGDAVIFQEIYDQVVKKGLETDLIIGNALVDTYVKLGKLEDAYRVFDSLPIRDVISWTAIVMGYAQNGLGHEILISLESMRQEGVTPNDVTYICSMKACGGSGAVDIGHEVHTQICMGGYDGNNIVGNALVDMYAKCGSLPEAWNIFHKLHVQDIVSWSALIAGHADKGESKIAIDVFLRMKDKRIEPDGVVCLSVLKACSHAGLVCKGQDIFDSMCEEDSIHLTIEHHNCMLDILCRAGQLKDAVSLIEKMPIKPNFVTWSILLAACQKWKNVELGRYAFDRAMKLDSKQVRSFIVMSSIYTDACMWEEAQKIDALRAELCM